MRTYVAAVCLFIVAGCSSAGAPVTAGPPANAASGLPSLAQRHALRRSSSGGALDPVAVAVADSAGPAAVSSAWPAARSLPVPMLGVTVDDIANTPGVVASLERLKNPVTRVYFDRQEPARYYLGSVEQFDKVGFTLGELLDSSDIGALSVSSVTKRTNQYLATLGSAVDVWEIGNEVNGEWLGANVPAKIHAMFSAVKAAGGRTEMTLYYEPPQTVTPGYDMIPWEEDRTNVPADMHAGLDYVLVSYYETDNNGIRPTQSQWNALFAKLAADFPHAKVGFGEVGMDDPATPPTLGQAENIMQYYYALRFPALAAFAGGDFWWYFAEDCVPANQPLLSELATY